MRIEDSLFKINNQLESGRVNLSRPDDSFRSFFDAALGLIDETNALQVDSEHIQLDYVTGKTDDIIALNLAQSKASNSLQFTAQITNKILAAYQEIMRIQL